MRCLGHNLAEHHTGSSTKTKSNQTERHNFKGIPFQECFRTRCCANRSTKQDNNNVHQRIRRGFCKLLYHAALAEQIAEHKHADKRCRGRKNQDNNHRHDNREQDSLKFRYRTKLLHLNLALLLRCQKTHDRRLDNRYKRHVRICCHSDRSHIIRLPKLSCKENRSRAVRTADNRDCRCRLIIKSHQDRHQVSPEYTDLSRSAKQETQRVRNQWTEVRHRTDTHKDQGRQDTPLI